LRADERERHAESEHDEGREQVGEVVAVDRRLGEQD
jgi:hypothetical protein